MKKILVFVLIGFLSVIGYLFITKYPQLDVVNSYAARLACTSYFEGQRDLENIKANELSYAPISMAELSINQEEQSVSSDVFGLKKKTAFYYKDCGCIVSDKRISKQTSNDSGNKNFVWDFPKKDQNAVLENLMQRYFDIDEAKFRSILIIHKDTVLAEKYGEGLNTNTPLLGWSMTKSITSALIGIAVKNGHLQVNQTNLFPEWEKDERSKISLKNLLQMNSGLEWEEEYAEISDATKMLFINQDIAPEILDNSLEYPIASRWEYSSGTTNLLLKLLRNTIGEKAYQNYPSLQLFDKLGMSTAFIETDASRNFIGSSYGYASARDWARFGKLYLDDGLTANGEQLLNKEWIDFSVAAISEKLPHYGAQWWLNHKQCKFKDAPSDLFYASGYQGQYVYVIPSKDLIIVRTGCNDDYDQNLFLKEVLALL